MNVQARLTIANICVSCGKPADVETETRFRPLTARGEHACESIKSDDTTMKACLECLMRVGGAIAHGDFDGEEGSHDN